MKAMVSVVADRGIGKKLPLDALRVGELARINLPGLESLQPDDIVSLRQNEKAFDDWHSTLSDVLYKIIHLRSDTFEREKEATKILEGRLLNSSRRLERTIQSSSALQKMRSHIQTFALGAVGAITTATLTEPGPAITSGAVTAAAGLLYSFLKAPEGTQAFPKMTPGEAQALRRHFAVFEKGTQ